LVNIDGGNNEGQRDLSLGYSVGQYGSLDITENADYYLGQPAFQGWFLSVRARVLPGYNLADGPHTFMLQHSIGGSTPPITVNIDTPVTPPAIGAPISFSTPPLSRYISGVPAAGPGTLTLNPVEIDNAVGHFYQANAVLFVTDSLGNTFTVGANDVPAINGIVHSAPLSLPVPTAYKEVHTVEVQAMNSIGEKGPAYFAPIPHFRTDPSLAETTYRVFSGDPTSLNPALSTLVTYDSTSSLVAPAYAGELQYINGGARWPAGDYSALGAPSYEGASGTTRWITLKFTPAKSLDNLKFILQPTATSAPWLRDVNKSVVGLKVLAHLNGTGWVDGNLPFVGYGSATADGEGVFDVGESSDDVRRLSFGTAGPFFGDVYIRLGLTPLSGLEVDIDSLISSIADLN
jgi:hypothetical protein